MNSTTAPTELPRNGNVDSWTEAQKAIVTAAGLTFTYPTWNNVPAELQGTTIPAPRAVVEHFLSVCAVTGLNPLARQVYCIARYGKAGVDWSIQTGIDGFRVVAERSKLYDGQTTEWMTKDQQWTDVFLPGIHGDHPLAARVRVYRKDWPDTRPSTGIAEWNAYVQTKRDGTPVEMWQKQGAGQLAKCAEALAHRKAFPQDLSGIYTEDEMAGPAAAIAQDRQAELAQYDWTAELEAVTTEEELAALQVKVEASDAGPEVFAALLARKAWLRDAANIEDAEVVPEEMAPDEAPVPASDAVTDGPASADAEPEPTPQTGAQRAEPTVEPEDWADDPEWKGARCPVCDMRHDITDHDDDEFTQAQALHQRAQTAAMKVAAEPVGPPQPRRFDNSAMRRR
jgi:phage recombination protein Bet